MLTNQGTYIFLRETDVFYVDFNVFMMDLVNYSVPCWKCC